MMRIPVVLMLLLLTGCLGQWEHPTKRRSEFRADDRDCQTLTGGAAQIQEPGGRERISYEGCMWDRGWVKKTDFWFFDPVPQ